MQKRRHFKQTQSLEERLAGEQRAYTRRRNCFRPGRPVRPSCGKSAKPTGSHVSEWLRSPGLQAPQ